MFGNIIEKTLVSQLKKIKDSTFIALVAVFAAFNIVCDSFIGPPLPFSGVWYSWVFISEPITGIILGPLAGFFSNLIGVMIGHFIYFRDVYEFLFTLGAPIGAMMSALIFRGKWKIPLIYYAFLLGAFLATPVTWQLGDVAFWGMWDVFLAFGCLLIIVVVLTKWKNLWNVKSKANLLYILALSTFIGLEADVLFRIFVFVPCQTYQLFYGYGVQDLQAIWALGAVETSIKSALSAAITVMVGLPIISVVRKMRFSLSED